MTVVSQTGNLVLQDDMVTLRTQTAAAGATPLTPVVGGGGDDEPTYTFDDVIPDGPLFDLNPFGASIVPLRSIHNLSNWGIVRTFTSNSTDTYYLIQWDTVSETLNVVDSVTYDKTSPTSQFGNSEFIMMSVINDSTAISIYSHHRTFPDPGDPNTSIVKISRSGSSLSISQSTIVHPDGSAGVVRRFDDTHFVLSRQDSGFWWEVRDLSFGISSQTPFSHPGPQDPVLVDLSDTLPSAQDGVLLIGRTAPDEMHLAKWTWASAGSTGVRSYVEISVPDVNGFGEAIAYAKHDGNEYTHILVRRAVINIDTGVVECETQLVDESIYGDIDNYANSFAGAFSINFDSGRLWHYGTLPGYPNPRAIQSYETREGCLVAEGHATFFAGPYNASAIIEFLHDGNGATVVFLTSNIDGLTYYTTAFPIVIPGEGDPIYDFVGLAETGTQGGTLTSPGNASTPGTSG